MEAEPQALSRALSDDARRVCRHLLPNGIEHKGDWLAGNVLGEAGRSLHVRLIGPKAGLWFDFANPEDRGDLLTLWQRNRGLAFADTCKEVAAWLGTPCAVAAPRRPIIPNPARPERSRTWRSLQSELRLPADNELARIAVGRRLPVWAGLTLARSAQCLFIAPVFDDGHCHDAWLITDPSRKAAQARRMDGLPWSGIGGKKAKTIAGTQANWPVGLAGATETEFMLVEGGPDWLAAWHLAWSTGRPARPVAMLGASNTIPDDALPLFRSGTVRIYPHADDNEAGEKAARRWGTRLQEAGCTVFYHSARSCGVKDLNELVVAMEDGASAMEDGA